MMIEINNLNKYYQLGKEKFHALKDVNVAVEKGEMVSIEGPSGAGKSTLLHIIGLLDGFDKGSYLLNGVDMKNLNDTKASRIRNEEIGFVMQDFSLINQKTVLFNVMLPLLFSKTPYSKIKGMAEDALESVGIYDQKTKKVNQLSGGQKQRVAIARAIVTNPSVILADEPTGALDSGTSRQIMELLQEINRRDNITMMIVTHNKLVSEYCCRTIYMLDGEIEQDRETVKLVQQFEI